ncbi:ankyrin repeat-containing domain protein [Aspergillus multicolor]|uniref:ankyrin repeat domain-containing protein n=1 Tax=Aspergillus multicolor TaxID=41759 RepID=UPI003CCDC283
MSLTWAHDDLESWNDAIDGLVSNGQHDVPDSNGATPLWHVANYGYANCVRKLCAAGVAIDRQDYFGRTALFRAAIQGHTEVVRVLLEYNANPDVWKPNKLSPIYEAITKRHIEVVKLLLSSQPKIKIPSTGPTSIWSVVKDQEMEDLLAQYGVTRQIA